jgi:hypothetical protein
MGMPEPGDTDEVRFARASAAPFSGRAELAALRSNISSSQRLIGQAQAAIAASRALLNAFERDWTLETSWREAGTSRCQCSSQLLFLDHVFDPANGTLWHLYECGVCATTMWSRALLQTRGATSPGA